MLFYYPEVGFGDFDAGGQDVLDADYHIGFMGCRGDFAFDAAEVTFDHLDFMAHDKRLAVETDPIGIQIHDEHKVCHLLVGNDKHGTGGQVAHIEKGSSIDIGDVAGGLLGCTDKYQVAHNGHFTFLPAILQLRNHRAGGKIVFKVQMFFGFQLLQKFADSKFLFVTGTGSKPIFLIFNHL